MTPTEQDKELREAITKIVEAEYKSPNYTPAVERVDHIMHLITADRKRVALEARIDEWNLIGETLHAASIESERHVEKVRNDRLDELSKKAGNDD